MEINAVPNASELNKPHHIRSNKENSKPTEIYIKKPRTCTLLDVSVSAFDSPRSNRNDFVFLFFVRLGLQAKLEGSYQSLSALLRRKATGGTSSIGYGSGESSECNANRQRMEDIPFDRSNGRHGKNER